MSYGLDDLFSGSSISGAASGAITGGMIGGPIGAGIGGLAGLGLGAYAHEQRDKSAGAQKSALDQYMKNIKALGQSSYDQHIADLKKVQSLYAVPQQQWNQLYGTGQQAQLGQGNWAGTGMAQGSALDASAWR